MSDKLKKKRCLKDLRNCSLRSAEENVYSNLSSEILFSHGYKCIRETNEKKYGFSQS